MDPGSDGPARSRHQWDDGKVFGLALQTNDG